MGADLALASAMLVYGLARSAEAKGKLEAAWKLQVPAELNMGTTGGVGKLGWTSRPCTSAGQLSLTPIAIQISGQCILSRPWLLQCRAMLGTLLCCQDPRLSCRLRYGLLWHSMQSWPADKHSSTQLKLAASLCPCFPPPLHHTRAEASI